MKNKNPNKVHTGIWLDEAKAIIITVTDGKHNVEIIFSEVESFHPSGGARSSTPWGPQLAIRESSFMNRKKQQLKKYYELIIERVMETDDLYILGPSNAKMGLMKNLEKNYRLRTIDTKTETSERLTENQLLSKVYAHFNLPFSKKLRREYS